MNKITRGDFFTADEVNFDGDTGEEGVPNEELVPLGPWKKTPWVVEFVEFVLEPVRAATTPKYAGLRTRFSSKRHADPVPGKVDGTQEYYEC
jgi:hypothetical protein